MIGVLLVVPDGNILPGAVVVDWNPTLRTAGLRNAPTSRASVRADLGGHLKYSRRWSGVRAGVLLGAQGAVRRGENRGGL